MHDRHMPRPYVQHAQALCAYCALEERVTHVCMLVKEKPTMFKLFFVYAVSLFFDLFVLGTGLCKL